MAFWGCKDVWIAKPLYRRLEMLAEELEALHHRQVDVDKLASAIIHEFVEQHFGETTRATARMVSGFQADEIRQDPTIKFFR